MEPRHVEQIRSFNRLISQRIGALDESYLARGRPLGEARVIFEIGSAGATDLRRLRRKLGLDSGYLSRLLRSMEKQGIVVLSTSDADARVRQVTLTEKGQVEYQAYDGLSNGLAEQMLRPLEPVQQARLVAAMTEVARLLRVGAIEVSLESPQSAVARRCLDQYFAEIGRRFQGGFDPAAGGGADILSARPPAGFFVVARLDGEPVGCGALKRLGPGIAEIKRVWTARNARGVGVASRLMDRLEGIAREAGFKTLRLDTNRALTEAHALYRKRGYRDIPRYNDNPYAHSWFEKQL